MFAFESIRFNAYSVQHLNVSDFAAVQVSTDATPNKANTKTVQNPQQLIISSKGLTVKAKDKRNTIRLHGVVRVNLIRHDGESLEMVLIVNGL